MTMKNITVREPDRAVKVMLLDASQSEPLWDLTELWQHRELLYFLVWREVKVRYKQTVIGVAWAVFQPLITMVLFAIIFGMFAKLPSDGLPYPVFAYSALLPWTYFSQAISRAAYSLLGDASLLQKVYFPRLILPIAAVIVPIIDFFLALLILLGMLVWFGITPTWAVLLLPVFLLMAFLTALAVGLWIAPLNVKYRDVNIAVPVLIQLWMYASPIVYPSSLVPEKWRAIYSLNPLVGVISGFRWALLDGVKPDFELMGLGVLAVVLLLWGGIVFFKRAEPTFADIV
jgi:lipopolysaccharide transport system permease protein